MAERKLTSQVLTWRAAIAQSGLPRSTRAVAWALANYMNDRGESAFPSVVTLCTDVGNDTGEGPASKRLVIDSLNALLEAGYLTKERAGGGRGKRASYAARFPETVQSQHRNDAQDKPETGAGGASRTRAPGPSGGAPGEAPAGTETVQSQHPLADAERVQSQHETVQSATGKGAVTAPEVEVEVDQEVAAATRTREAAAAAAQVEERLTRLNVLGGLREQALAEPERALAWLELAQVEAHRNPAGFFRMGFDTGAYPSPRLDPAGETPSVIDRKRASIANLVDLGIDRDEIAYFIDVEWETLAAEERAELHEHLAELLSGAPPARPALRAVDAA